MKVLIHKVPAAYTVNNIILIDFNYNYCDFSRKQFPSPMVGSTPAAPSIPAWQRNVTVTSTERTRTTSSLTDSSEPPGVTEPSDSKEQSFRKVSSLEHSSMNGGFDSSRDFVQYPNVQCIPNYTIMILLAYNSNFFKCWCRILEKSINVFLFLQQLTKYLHVMF